MALTEKAIWAGEQSHRNQALGRTMETGLVQSARDRGQIPIAFERLQRNVTLLEEITAQLEDRTAPVVDQNGLNRPSTGDSSIPCAPVCGMAVSIRNTSDSLENILTRLQNIHNFIQL